jgi:hypothetical protein
VETFGKWIKKLRQEKHNGLAEILEIDPAALIELAVHQDEELVKRLRFGMDWREREREDSEDCYLRYLAKANRLRKGEYPNQTGS